MNYDVLTNILGYLEMYDWLCFANASRKHHLIWKKYAKGWRYVIHCRDYTFSGSPASLIYGVLDDLLAACEYCKNIIKSFHGVCRVEF